MNIIRKQAMAIAVIFTALATSVHASVVTIDGPLLPPLPGTSFDITLTGNFDDVSGFKGGRVEFLWDNLGYTHNSTTLELPGLVASFSCPGNPTNCTSDPGQESVAWGTFFNPNPLIPAGAGDTLMATINFTAPLGGSPLATFSMIDSPFGWTDQNGTPTTAPDLSSTYSIPTAVIPVPAAVWLFGSGLLGLVGVARRRKAA